MEGGEEAEEALLAIAPPGYSGKPRRIPSLTSGLALQNLGIDCLATVCVTATAWLKHLTLERPLSPVVKTRINHSRVNPPQGFSW